MNWTQYRTNLWRYAHVHWLWTRRKPESNFYVPAWGHLGIYYKPRWTPLSFLPVYLTSYLISTLLGHGVRPFSGVLWERAGYNFTKRFQGDPFQHPNAELLAVRFLNWITRDPKHCYKAARAPA